MVTVALIMWAGQGVIGQEPLEGFEPSTYASRGLRLSPFLTKAPLCH